MPTLYFREEGKGFPLVFLHGFCETHEIWKDFVGGLAEDFHIFMLDLPGFGKSDPLVPPFSIDQVGDSVALWLNANKIGKCVVIGHSLGGYVALSLAELHSESLIGLGLFHSTCFADTDEKKANRNKVIEFVDRNGVPPYIETFVPGLFFDKSSPSIQGVHRIAMQTRADTLTGYVQAMRDRPDRSFILRNHEISKFVIAGMEDTLVPISNSRKMIEIAQNCRYFELEKVGHMGFLEAKSECQTAISESLRSIIINNA